MVLLEDKITFFKEEDKNIKQFYNMYLHQKNQSFNSISELQATEEEFRENVYNWLMGSFFPDSQRYLFYYYIELYSCFFYFNHYYENNYNFFPTPAYFPTRFNYNNYNNIAFFLLDYNIGNYSDKNLWETHCKNVEKTLIFIKENNLILSKEIKYIENDKKVLTEIFSKFIKIINSGSKITIDDLQIFEKEIMENLENKKYALITIDSLKRNVSYLDKYFLDIIDKQKRIETEIKSLNEENKKAKDFYLTVSGSVMALISLIIGNFSLISKDIIVPHIFIFNGSILLAIYIFSYLFFSLYTKDTKTYPKRFTNMVVFTIFSFFICLSIYLFLLYKKFL